MIRAKVALVALLAAVMATLVILHTKGVNGIAFFPWQWRALAPATPIYLLFGLAIVPALAAQWTRPTSRANRAAAILLLMLSCFSLKIASVVTRSDITGASPNLSVIATIVHDPSATGYYNDATTIRDMPLGELLKTYPELMRRFHLHSATKPPGPLLYWVGLIRLLGENDRTALMGGLILGALATLSIPATYGFLKLILNGDGEAAFAGASFLSLCPGFVLFFPMFDPIYILLSTAMIGFWYAALKHDQFGYAALLGLTLSILSMITFNVLVVGAFMAGLTLIVPAQRLGAGQRTLLMGRHALIAVACVMSGLMLLLLYGYDAPETLISACKNQYAFKKSFLYRPLPYTIPLDLLDFALGSGWISVLLVIFYLVGERRHLALIGLAIAQLMLVAITGLLQLETSRVWNFMLPLLMLPIALELRNWPNWARAVCLICLGLVTAAIHQNMKLIL